MKNVLIVFSGKAQSGKCFGKNTPVLMYDGSVKNVQDVKVGDLLMGDDSTPRKVLSLSRGKDSLYKIQQSRGMNYTVNGSHILSLKWTHYNNSHKTGELEDIELKKYLKLNKTKKRHLYGYSNPVEFKHQELLIEPYFLGIWLGDGNSDNTGVTTIDEEIISHIKKYSQKLRLKVRTTKKNLNVGNSAQSYYITAGNIYVKPTVPKNILLTNLKKLNLIKNKHIPDVYKINSKKNRLQLLAGLIDTDGHYKGRGQFEISQKNEVLAKDIMFLSQSLGFYTSIKKEKKECVNNGVWGEYYRIGIYGNIESIPTKIKRKIAKKRIRNINSCLSSINVKSLKRGNYYGFVLDGNHRFLLEDFTVVHNSTCSNLLKEILGERQRNEFVERHGKAHGLKPVSNVHIHSFAKALKEISEKYFGWGGDKKIYMKTKEGIVEAKDVNYDFEPIPDRGRQLLINIGQAFRAIRPTIWVDYVINKIKKHSEGHKGQGHVYLIDDMRFKNELELVKTFNKCISVRITRPSSLNIDDISENDLDDAEFDHYIDNNGNMTMLRGTLNVLWDKIAKEL